MRAGSFLENKSHARPYISTLTFGKYQSLVIRRSCRTVSTNSIATIDSMVVIDDMSSMSHEGEHWGTPWLVWIGWGAAVFGIWPFGLGY